MNFALKLTEIWVSKCKVKKAGKNKQFKFDLLQGEVIDEHLMKKVRLDTEL